MLKNNNINFLSTNYHNEVESAYNNIHDNKVFGFWIYLMSDCILFAALFATYAVMVNNTANGPTGKDIFHLPFIFAETMVLLFSSITEGMCMLSINKTNIVIKKVIFWLGLTFILGLFFLFMELYEFYNLIHNDFGPSSSGFLSSLFTLVGTHGIHVFAGLIWILILIYQVTKKKISSDLVTRLSCFSLFWHFLDVIWICLFTVVYLVGIMK
ncbi:MAG: cytochrome o ubiquinol oxidase subunit III [Candidatus Dasytiphilus stammeri]